NANRMVGENFWPVAHRPSLSELRFFVAGPGRFLLRWLARARRPSPVAPLPLVRRPTPELQERELPWVRIQRGQCLQPAAPAAKMPQAPSVSVPTEPSLHAAAGDH